MNPLDAPALEHVLLPVRPGPSQQSGAASEAASARERPGSPDRFPVVEHVAAVGRPGDAR